MDQRELNYLNERAAAELKAAQRAATARAARAHYGLAALYAEKAEALKRQLTWNGAGAEEQSRLAAGTLSLD